MNPEARSSVLHIVDRYRRNADSSLKSSNTGAKLCDYLANNAYI